MVDSTLGSRIRQARTQKGWTAAELAERAGLSRPTLTNLEGDARGPSVTALVAIANALGVSVGWLLAEATPVPHPQIIRAEDGDSGAAIWQRCQPESQARIPQMSSIALVELPGLWVTRNVLAVPADGAANVVIVNHALSGTATYFVDDRESFDLGPGDTVTFTCTMGARLVPHREPFEFLAIGMSL